MMERGDYSPVPATRQAGRASVMAKKKPRRSGALEHRLTVAACRCGPLIGDQLAVDNLDLVAGPERGLGLIRNIARRAVIHAYRNVVALRRLYVLLDLVTGVSAGPG